MPSSGKSSFVSRTTGCGVERRLAPAHLDVVAVEGDVDRAERDLAAAELGDQAPQALRERDAARVDADERDVARGRRCASMISCAIRARRALDRLAVEQDLLGGDAGLAQRLALRERAGAGVRVHRTPFRPLWTELKGFGSSGTVAGSARTESMIAPMAPRRFTPKDVLRETFLTQLAVAPDGSSVVYGAAHDRGRRVPDAALARADERRARGADHDRRRRHRGPRFSPDGKTLLFLSARSGKSQPWLLPLAGGEPRQLAEFDGQVGAAEWSPDGSQHRACSPRAARSASASAIRSSRRRAASPTSTGGSTASASATSSRASGSSPARGGRPEAAHRARLRGRPAPSGRPTAKRIGVPGRPEARGRASSSSPRPGRCPPTAGAPTKHAELRGEIAGAAFSPGGRLALRRPRRPDVLAASTNLGLVGQGRAAGRGGSARSSTARSSSSSSATFVDFARASRRSGASGSTTRTCVVLVTDRGACVPYRFGLDGSTERLVERDDAVCTWLALGGGPPRDHRERRRRRVRRLRGRGRRPAQALAQRRLAGSRPYRRDPERHAVRHRDGHEIDAWLVRPRGRRSRGLVLQIHGGPHLAHGPAPWLEMVALADAGFTVLYGNPRGSVGYGEAFAKAIDGQLGRGGRRRTCMRLVDWAVRQGLATARPRRPARALVRRLHDELAARPPPRPLRGGRQREPGPRPLLVLRRVRLRVHDRRARGRRRRALGRLPADARPLAGARSCTATRRRSCSSRPRATSAVPRARPRSRSRCCAASAARSRWCATRTSST